MKKFFLFTILFIITLSLVGCSSLESSSSSTAEPTTELTTNEHVYGSMYYRREANFFEDGYIAHYICEDCGKYFDESFNEVESIVIPKYSKEIVLLVNGEAKKEFKIEEETESTIYWLIDDLPLKKGDEIKVADKLDNSIVYNYLANTNSNITEDKKVHNDCMNATIDIVYTLNGMYLSISGLEYDGIVVRVTSDNTTTEYPMTNIKYNFTEEHNSFVYGYHYFSQDDEFVVVDKDNNIVYDYDSISTDSSWNSFTFTKGSNDSIKVSRDIKVGIEFDVNGDKSIYLDTVYEPNQGSDYYIEFNNDQEALEMSTNIISRESNEYKNSTYVLNHESTKNSYVYVDYLNVYDYTIYYYYGDLEANTEFRILNKDRSTYIEPNHLSNLYDLTMDDIELEEDYIKIKNEGTYFIYYFELFDTIIISKGESGGFSPTDNTKVYLILSSANGSRQEQIQKTGLLYVVKDIELLESDLFSILYGSKNLAYSNVTKGKDLVSSIAAGGYAYLMPKTRGIYTITFDATTESITIELKEDITTNVLVKCKLYDSKKLNEMVLDGDEFKYTLDVTQGMYLAFLDQDSNSVDDFVLEEGYDSETITLFANMIYILKDANVTVSINKTTHRVTIVINN